ncbi:hypothetical protein LEP3755_55380 [Leptolyngbya sp. NIES-3755]|nr:hypothetical protein LEP3755_55380 [Leptolyngbya sp. NIES-3755]
MDMKLTEPQSNRERELLSYANDEIERNVGFTTYTQVFLCVLPL